MITYKKKIYASEQEATNDRVMGGKNYKEIVDDFDT